MDDFLYIQDNFKIPGSIFIVFKSPVPPISYGEIYGT